MTLMEKYRTDKMCQLKYLNSNENSAKILVTSFILADLIATNSESFTEGLIETAKTICPGNVPRIQKRSHGRNTMTEHTHDDIADDFRGQLRPSSKFLQADATAVHEGPDVKRY